MERRNAAVAVLDTTLRDGAQGAGIAYSLDDKLKLAALLDALGVAFIEAGNPASNPKDAEFFRRAAGLRLKNSKLVAFGSTRRAGVCAYESPALAALAAAGTEWVSIFGKAWDFHVTQVLHTTREENLAMIADSVAFLRSCGKRVIFDAEHFFDGYAADPDYAMAALCAADGAGADVLTLCDTAGGAAPDQVRRVVGICASRFPGRVGVHFHNDAGLAAANTVVAVGAGAAHIHGTINGYGERCGNANLCSVLPTLALKMDCACLGSDTAGRLRALTDTARAVAELSNLPFDERQPYVGRDAFTHKGGMHADGVLKTPASFEHLDPALVGNCRRFPLSEVSGRAMLLDKLSAIAPDVTGDAARASALLEELKTLEYSGYQFDGAEESFELIVLRALGRMPDFFTIRDFKVISGTLQNDQSASALIKVEVGGHEEMTAAEGNGPVDALDKALRKAIGVFYPCLEKLTLTDFKVRVIDTGRGTASKVRVQIVSSDGAASWGTVGVSENVLQASWNALIDSIEYMLLKRNGEKND